MSRRTTASLLLISGALFATACGTSDATAAGGAAAANCTNWTSSAANVQAMVGHSNRAGGGAAPTSWNAAHAITGCKEGTGAGTVASGGGRGSIYCFVP